VRVSHAARHNHRCRPGFIWHFVGGRDAEYEAACGDSAFCDDSRRRTAATTYNRDAETSQQCAGIPGEFVCSGAGLGAAEDADLGATN
jgi:hypothetical protein